MKYDYLNDIPNGQEHLEIIKIIGDLTIDQNIDVNYKITKNILKEAGVHLNLYKTKSGKYIIVDNGKKMLGENSIRNINLAKAIFVFFVDFLITVEDEIHERFRIPIQMAIDFLATEGN